MSRQRPEEYKEKLLDALERHLGIVTGACKDVGVTRKTFYQYYKDDLDFKKSVDDINNITLDFVENQLLKQIKEGSERSILFYMKYRGRTRGYTDSVDITSGGEKLLTDIKINIVLPKKEDEEDGD